MRSGRRGHQGTGILGMGDCLAWCERRGEGEVGNGGRQGGPLGTVDGPLVRRTEGCAFLSSVWFGVIPMEQQYRSFIRVKNRTWSVIHI